MSYTYQKASDDANHITSNMTSMRYTFGGKQTFADYSYDNIGNIKHAEYKYDSVPYTFVDYNYDRYNQLTKEVHSPLSMGIDLRSAEYAYDEFGNITDVTRTDSSGKVTKNRYVYSDKTGWQDLLTSYDGHTITYDEIGNPLSYYNGRSYTLRWEMGRQLLNSRVNSRTVYYDYNKDGIRTKKTVSDKYTDRYILDGDKLVGLERTRKGSTVKDTYYFIYDEMGTIWEAICYVGGATEPVRYFYRTNAQGDVKQIVDKDNNVIAYYDYDAWGGQLAVYDGNDKPVSGDSHFANVNPFRYRGYIYDTETGFYYLQSRYYDPEIGRFINADGQFNKQDIFSGYNLFAYCDNSPVNKVDSTGKAAVISTFAVTACIVDFSALLLIAMMPHAQISLPSSPSPALPKPNIAQARKDKASDSLAKIDEKDAVDFENRRRDGQTYYHFTTAESAATIQLTGLMYGNSWEGGFVFAWREMPDAYVRKLCGAHDGVLISFKTIAAFEDEHGIDIERVNAFKPVRSVFRGPINVWDVKVVGVYGK